MKYEVVKADSIDALEKQVAIWSASGFLPSGGVATYQTQGNSTWFKTWFIQAMVRP